MKNKKSTIIILLVVIILVGFYGYMFAIPMSYGMGYHNVSAYEDEIFECTQTFYRDGTMVVRNTNFDEEYNARYYYKDGYVFYLLAQTDDEYEAEVALINENFEEAIRTPFYADKINAFRTAAVESDGYATIYNCTPQVVLSVVVGLAGLVVIVLSCLAGTHHKKINKEKK